MGMSFELSEEHRMLRDLVKKFVDDELMPLEKVILEREATGQGSNLTKDEMKRLDGRARELGLAGLDAPEEFDGFDMPVEAMVGVAEELGKTCVQYLFPPDSPNLRMLMLTANDAQKQRYLGPYARGELTSAIAISEPGGGGDPASMRTRAVADGGDYVINGRKIWISKGGTADFIILMASTDPTKGAKGITAFLVDQGTKGWNPARRIPMLGGHYTWEIAIEDMRLPKSAVLGEIGNGYGPMQQRLSTRRVQMAAKSCGTVRRALDMMREWVTQRKTFGALLSDRQSIQWWIAEAAMKIHACRLMVYDAAAKSDAGKDVRTEASMVKLYGSEMATETIDHAMQTFGAMGVAKELPLQLFAQRVRTMRVYEGPSEVHRMVIARRLLQDRR